jgi:hypothetical protein
MCRTSRRTTGTFISTFTLAHEAYSARQMFDCVSLRSDRLAEYRADVCSDDVVGSNATRPVGDILGGKVALDPGQVEPRGRPSTAFARGSEMVLNDVELIRLTGSRQIRVRPQAARDRPSSPFIARAVIATIGTPVVASSKIASAFRPLFATTTVCPRLSGPGGQR